MRIYIARIYIIFNILRGESGGPWGFMCKCEGSKAYFRGHPSGTSVKGEPSLYKTPWGSTRKINNTRKVVTIWVLMRES